MPSTQPKRVFRRLIAIAIVIVGLYLFVCYNLAVQYLHPSRIEPVKPANLVEVQVDTRFGPTPAWASPGIGDGKPSPVIFLMIHGYGGSRGSWTEPMEKLSQHGFDSVALAMPGQDASPVKSVSFGINDSQVVVDGVHWLRKRFPGRKVVVLGISMGGAATWLATKEEPNIDGIVTDAAFARFDESMNAFFERKIRGGAILLKPVVWFAERQSGLDPSSVRPIDAAPLWKGKPALVIQGDADTLVVPSHAQRLAQASGATLWIVPRAGHAQCYDVDPNGYLNHLIQFAERIEGKTPNPVKG